MNISPVERVALSRFRDCSEDPGAGGHDVPKAMMQRLAAVGVVRTLGFGRYETTQFGDWLLAQPPGALGVPTQAAPQMGAQEPERMDTDQSREYLVQFMRRHFTDKTFHRYILADEGRNGLAGDFAWQMARALRMLATPAAQGVAKELTDDEIVQVVRSVGVDTHPSKFGFSVEQIEGMSVAVLRLVIAAIAAKAGV